MAGLTLYSLARDGFLYAWEFDEGAGAWRCRCVLLRWLVGWLLCM